MNNKKKILILDDEPIAGGRFSDMLSEDGYEIYRPEDACTAIDLIRNNDISALITDFRMSCSNGKGVHEYVAKNHPEIPVILLNALQMEKSLFPEIAVKAFCYFNTSPDYHCLRGVLARAIEQYTLKKEVAALKNRLDGIRNRIIGNSREMFRIFDVIKAVKNSCSSVLISGEAGTGKELIARTINSCGEKRGPFITFNCSAIPKELIEAELFGWDRGGFSGATSRMTGKFGEAANGTLFLEGIGDLELSLQAKLFGVIRERDIQYPGDNLKSRADFRLISSTRRDLKKEVKNGNFREDLFYRINQVEIAVPSLRERKDDIPLLFSAFMNEFCEREKKNLTVSEKVMKSLEEYSWPGNVRQLRNIAEKAVVLATGDKITLRELPVEIISMKKTLISSNSLKTLRELEKDALKNALQACKGNKSMACRILGISRKAMYRLLRECQL